MLQYSVHAYLRYFYYYCYFHFILQADTSVRARCTLYMDPELCGEYNAKKTNLKSLKSLSLSLSFSLSRAEADLVRSQILRLVMNVVVGLMYFKLSQ